jgi:mannose-6-phosphate isomerase-like protein (cupin superfamily)
LAPTGETAGRYRQRMARVGQQLGAQKLGYRLYVLEPGMRGSPFHSHRVNEEMFYVVAGEEIRLGAERFPIRAGDVIASRRAVLKRRTRSSIPALQNCVTWRSAPSSHRKFANIRTRRSMR